MSRIDISVVIVSYNVKSFLDHCLQSVRRASAGLQVQILVVDNASTDGSPDLVRQRYPEVTLLVNTENLGFARANNQAFEKALGETVLVINPDAFVQEDTLRQLLQRLRADPRLGAIGPKIIQPDGRFEPRSKRGFPTPWVAFSFLSGLSALFPRSPFFSRYLLTYLDENEEHEVEALSGCCMLLRREALQQVNGFDGDYFLYGEDLDLCYRIRQAGYAILYTPITNIVHFKGESTLRSTIDRSYHFRRAMRLFVEKNLTAKVSLPARWALTFGFGLQRLERGISKVLTFATFPLIDALLLNVLILSGRTARFSGPFYTSEVWLINGVYTLFYLVAGLLSGSYGLKRLSGRSALIAAISGALAASAFTYFFKQWAWSRFVVLWFGLGMLICLPGWRSLVRRWWSRSGTPKALPWRRRKTLIVGTDALAQNMARRILDNPRGDWELVGFAVFSEEGVGEIINGLPVLGTVQELDQLIRAEAVQEVLFSTGETSYETIIALVQKLWRHSLDFQVITREPFGPEDELPLLRLERSSLAQKGTRRRFS